MLKKLNFSKKGFELAIIFGLLCAIFWSVADFNASCEQLRKNVLRLHIVANSDSKADQALKLKIRDRILEESKGTFEGITDKEEAIRKARISLDKFENIANAVIEENGFPYKARVKIGKAYFETREYENFTLPAGSYESLVIKLGKAEGKNWWCVIFPQVCLPAASDADLSDSVNDSGVRVAENPKNYEVRFKVVEIYEGIKHFLFG